jgi:F0F1-type ATP synthase epsilon subunit
MPEARTFRCEVFTASGPVFQTEATSVVLPAHDGLLGVLRRRAPLVAALGSGSLFIRASDASRHYRLAGGVAHMRRDVLTILAEQCQLTTEAEVRWFPAPLGS